MYYNCLCAPYSMLFRSSHFFFLFIVFVFHKAYTQKAVADSLKNVLSTHEAQDTIRVNLLNELGFASFRINPSKIEDYATEAEKLAITLNFKKGIAESTRLKGLIHFLDSDYDEAVRLLNDSYQRYDSINHTRGLAKCNILLGHVAYYRGDYQDALVYYQDALEVYEGLGDRKAVAGPLNNIANVYTDMGNYNEGIEFYERALQIYQEFNMPDLQSSFNNLGIAYSDLNNYPLALDYYQKSLALAERQQDSTGIAYSLNNIAVAYKKMDRYGEALDYYQKSAAILKSIGNRRAEGETLGNIGNIYNQKKAFDQAIKYIKKALVIAQEIGNKKNMGACLNNLGSIYSETENYDQAVISYQRALEIKEEIQDQKGICVSTAGLAWTYYGKGAYSQALTYAEKNLQRAKEIGFINFQMDSYELMALTYAKIGRYEEAYNAQKKYKLFSDSVFSEEQIRKIAELESEYTYKARLDSARLREQMLTQKVEVIDKDLAVSERQRLLAIIGILLLITVLTITILWFRIKNIRFINQTILIEQRLLRSQMTPHFIFNSLSVLQGIILNKEYKKSVGYLAKFSRLLRLTLENSRDKTVKLSNELAAIEKYLEVQNLGTDFPINYHVSIDGVTNLEDIQIPPMMIQPFVENAVEHGFEKEEKRKEIVIHFWMKHDQLTCEIKDNGKGVDSTTTEKHTSKKSLSTSITKERLALFAKEFKVPTGIRINDRKSTGEQGTVVTLILPYKLKLA